MRHFRQVPGNHGPSTCAAEASSSQFSASCKSVGFSHTCKVGTARRRGVGMSERGNLPIMPIGSSDEELLQKNWY